MQIEMTIKGLMVDPITNMPIVILRDKEGQKVLPIWVGIFEANAIALQIENIATPRPMTHDLLRNIIHDLKATVQKIVVCDLQENTFYALIYLDPQANSTMSFLDMQQVVKSVYDAIADPHVALNDVILRSPLENLWVAPSRIALAKLEARLVGEMDAHFRLKDKLESVRAQ